MTTEQFDTGFCHCFDSDDQAIREIHGVVNCYYHDLWSYRLSGCRRLKPADRRLIT